jgi:hypothetical protein
MHHFMHTITLHLHTFSSFCFVLQSKPSLYVSNIRKKVLQISKCDLSSIRSYLQVFKQNSKENRKEKESKKGRRAALRPRPASGPRPVLPLLPNRYRFSSLQPLMEGPHLSSHPKKPGRARRAPERIFPDSSLIRVKS